VRVDRAGVDLGGSIVAPRTARSGPHPGIRAARANRRGVPRLSLCAAKPENRQWAARCAPIAAPPGHAWYPVLQNRPPLPTHGCCRRMPVQQRAKMGKDAFSRLMWALIRGGERIGRVHRRIIRTGWRIVVAVDKNHEERLDRTWRS